MRGTRFYISILGAGIGALAVLGFAGLYLFVAPQSERAWDSGYERAAAFIADPSAPKHAPVWRLLDLRAYEFETDGARVKSWQDISFRPADLEEVWFFIEPFSGSDWFAHSYLSFVFGGADPITISVSVEARRETGEEYSPVRGLLRAYELSYVWSTEKDIHTRIAIDLDHKLKAYRLNIPSAQAQAILAHFIRRTNNLKSTARFYNTVTSNCTNELAKAVNDAFPGALPWHRSFVLTGRSAEHLHSLGFLENAEIPFAEIDKRADIAPFVKAHSKLKPEAFARAWRADRSRAAELD